MTISDIILNKGEIILKQTIVENIYLDNCPFLYGVVNKTNDLSDDYNVDDIVLFNAGTATKFLLDNNYYYLILEKDIYSTFINIAP